MTNAQLVWGSLGTWALTLVVVLILGIPLAVLFAKSVTPAAVRIALWGGITLFAIVTTVINQFVPLRSAAAVWTLMCVLAFAGALAWILIATSTRNSWQPKLRDWNPLKASGIFLVLAFILVSAWWIIGATRAPTNYDSGLYHIQAIWYAADYKTIPGLVNLFHSFGFSNSLNPIAAMTANGPLGLEAYRVINGFFYLLFFAEIILRLTGSARNRVGTKILIISLAVFVAPMIGMVDYWVVSPTFDTPVAILTFVSVAATADLLTRRIPKVPEIVLSLLPLALASSMRQHFWFLFAITLVIVIWKVVRAKSFKRSRTAIVVSTVVATVLFGVMIARDYLLSGWVMYPYKTFSFNVDWLAPDPADLINATKQWARSQTPAYQQASEGWEWVRPWLGANYKSWVVIALLSCLLVAVIVTLVVRAVWRPKTLLLILAPQVLLLATWFFLGAPHIRYVWAPVLLLGVLPLAWAWTQLGISTERQRSLFTLALWLNGLGLSAVVIYAWLTVFPRLDVQMPTIPVQAVATNNSLTLLVPEATDQCWENYPMCSGLTAVRFEPRGNAVTDGFRSSAVD